MRAIMKSMPMESSGNVDADFLLIVIPHHQSAIDMAKVELEQGTDEETRKMAQMITMPRKRKSARCARCLSDLVWPPRRTDATYGTALPRRCPVFMTAERRSMQDHDKHGQRSNNASDMQTSGSRVYWQLLLWLPVHVAAMYLLMFAMIDTLGDFWNNVNMFWMAVLMAAPMNIIMIVSMPGMYPDRAKTIASIAITLALVLGSWLAIRQQWAVGDGQFLRSMIPHHSGAILMCQEAVLTDPRIVKLCDGIVAGQRAEIAEMERLLAER